MSKVLPSPLCRLLDPIEQCDSDPHPGDSFSYSSLDPELDEEEAEAEEYAVVTVVVSAMDDMRVTKLTALIERHISETEEPEEE